MNVEVHPSDAKEPRGVSWRMLLPIAVIVILGGVTLLLARGGSGKQALPGSARTASSTAFAGALLEPPQPAPALSTLHNYDGTAFDLRGDLGKATFVTFLYTHCPDVCPLIASNLHVAYLRMPASLKQRVAIVAVSVDPRGDTAQSVAAFVKLHRLAGEASYLIGSTRPLARVWEAWKVGSERDASNPELVNHSGLVYGIGANGEIYTIYPSNFTPAQIVHDVPPLLGRSVPAS
jgi:protein SCO1/2